MGSYTFSWAHPADEVYVTGTFDDWSKSVKLDKKDVVHEKTVSLRHDVKEAILYKFVVDGKWVHDPTKKTEKDHEGNLNNILEPEEIGPPNSMAAHTISSVAPASSTAQLAGQQPLESERASVPGAFPETPAVDTENDDKKKDLLAGAAIGGTGIAAAGATATSVLGGSDKKALEQEQEQEQIFSVNPIPASAGIGNPIKLAPGEPVPASSEITGGTITSAVHDDPSLKSSAQDAEQTFGIAPIPASGGIGNPIHLQPGEQVPHPNTITGNTLTSNVKLDHASYEKSDAGAPIIPPSSGSQGEKDAAGASIFGLGPQTSNMIPESSIGMGHDAPAPLDGAALSSVGAESTTNQLAGLQPLQPRGVPETVAVSQLEAHAAPEASANPTAVEEKTEMENELKSKVPEAKAGSDDKTGVYGMVAGGLAAAAAAVTGSAVVAREKTHETTGTDPVSVLPASIQKSIDGQNEQSDTTSAVPAEVTKSQQAAHVSPEAAANPEAVQEKSQIEQELLQTVPKSQATGEPARTTTAATSATAPTTSTSTSGAPRLGDPVGGGLAPIILDDKPAGSEGLNAPADAQAQSTVSKEAAVPAASAPSRDISPMTRPATDAQTQPTVTTGTDSGATASQSTPVGTPRTNTSGTSNKRNSIIDKIRGTPDSQKTTGSEGKKKKGFLSKIKEKLRS